MYTKLPVQWLDTANNIMITASRGANTVITQLERASDMSRLAVAAATPFVPLLLTVFSLEELIMRLIKVLF